MSSPNLSCGSKGRFRASGIEFEITQVKPSASVIRYRHEREEIEVSDDDLRALADGIPEWGAKAE